MRLAHVLQDAWLTALQVHPSQHPCACVLYMDDGDDVLRTLAPSPRHDLHRVLMDPVQQLGLKKGALLLLCMLCMLALTRARGEACAIDAGEALVAARAGENRGSGYPHKQSRWCCRLVVRSVRSCVCGVSRQ